MAVRKIKTSWWVDFTFNEKRYRKRSPENSRPGALAYELMLRQRLARGQPLDDKDQKQQETFDEFAAKWVEDYVKPNNKYSEQLAKGRILATSLIPFFGSTPIALIGPHEIEQYKALLAKKGLSNKTIRNRLTVLNKCLSTAYEWGQFEGRPPRIKWPRCATPKTDYLSAEECRLLLSHASGLMHEMILIALRTGMRQGEIKGLQWSAINWETQSVAVRHSRDDYRKVLVPTKNNRERHIPLDVEVNAMLHRRKSSAGYVFLQRNGQPFNYDRLGHAIGKLCSQAGLRRIGWHTLRHTFASQLAMRGVPLPVIKELLGHASIMTTMRYSHVAPSTLRAAIDILNPRTLAGTNLGQPAVNQWQELQRREIGRHDVAEKYA